MNEEDIKPLEFNEKFAAVLHAAAGRDAIVEEVKHLTMDKLRLMMNCIEAITNGSTTDEIAEVEVRSISKVIDRIIRLTDALNKVLDQHLIQLAIDTLTVATEGVAPRAADNYQDAIKILQLWLALATDSPALIASMAVSVKKVRSD